MSKEKFHVAIFGSKEIIFSLCPANLTWRGITVREEKAQLMINVLEKTHTKNWKLKLQQKHDIALLYVSVKFSENFQSSEKIVMIDLLFFAQVFLPVLGN